MSLILEFQSTDQGGNGISAEYHHGIITKAVGGIYYVDALSGFEKDGRGVPDGTTFKCAARGLFRKNEISPSAGDNVIVECQENHEPLISKILERRNYLVERMNQIDGVSCLKPDGAFYVMMNLEKLIGRTLGGRVIHNADDFAMAFLEKGLVAVVSCCAFDAPNFVRWTYATSLETIKEGLDRLEKFLKEG